MSLSLEREALSYLNAVTTLVVPCPFNRNDPFMSIPRDCLTKAESITVHIDALVHIRRRLLPSLKRVHLTYEIDHPISVPEVVGFLVDHEETGGIEALVRQLFKNVFNWRWKVHQFARLCI